MHIRTSDSTDQIWPAIFSVQTEMPMVVKGKEADAGKYKFSYADLPLIWSSLQPTLKKHHLIVLQGAGKDEVTTRLHHVPSGQWIEGDSPMFVTLGGSTKETYGSQTMARRHGIMSLLFIVAAGDDDDARMAHETQRRAQVGYMDDAIKYLVKLGMGEVEAGEKVKAEVGDRDPLTIERDGWLEIVDRLKSQIPEAEDPLLNGESGNADQSEPNPLEDDDHARKLINDTMKGRGWSNDDKQAYIDTWLGQLGVEFGQTTADQRHKFIAWMNGERSTPTDETEGASANA